MSTGVTTLIPGTAIAQFSIDCECWAPKRSPPPLPVLMTSGRVTCPPVMYRVLAIWLTTRSQQTAKKSENMISATGRRPVIAAPMAAPRMACSEIGVSMTRFGTELVEQADRGLEHPAGAGDVLADEDHAVVAAHLLGDAARDGVAIGQLRHDQPPSAQTSVNALSGAGSSPATASSVARSTSGERPRRPWRRARLLGTPEAQRAARGRS